MFFFLVRSFLKALDFGKKTQLANSCLFWFNQQDGLFIITLIPSEASIRCNIEPRTYMLQMTPTELQLKSEDLNVTIAMWPYRFIRKYGYRDGKFQFEAGRKCTTGEGVFTLDHTNPQEVFRCMSAKMKSMKKLISGDSLSSIECVENQFSAAACMEPGSRSPLPPSPSSNPHAGEFEINSTQSCISLRGFISSNDSLNNFSANGSANSISLSVPSQAAGKHIPNKPPRKLPTPLEKLNMGPAAAVAAASLTPAPAPATVLAGTITQCDKYKNLLKYEPVAITTSSPSDANGKSSGSAVILKPASPDPLRASGGGGVSSSGGSPPDLPLRNESCCNKLALERDYESIENITEAWKTRGVGDVRHCERIPSAISCDSDFVRQRSQSQRDKRKDLSTSGATSGSSTPKIIDIDIGEGVGVLVSPDANYDRLDFLSPNNKTSSGYKTIVNVTLPANRMRCSPPPPNEYELIASPDTESFRKADDSHLGYGVLRKAANNTAISNNNNNTNNNNNNNNNNTNNNNNNINVSNNNNNTTLPATNNNSNNNNSSSSSSNLTGLCATPTTNLSNDAALDHRNYNGLNYTIVSKPKRV